VIARLEPAPSLPLAPGITQTIEQTEVAFVVGQTEEASSWEACE